jgi:hypothetical protein
VRQALLVFCQVYLTAPAGGRQFGGRSVPGGFFAVTPAWWVAARASLLAQPNAMLLWAVTIAVTTLGWFWHRFR